MSGNNYIKTPVAALAGLLLGPGVFAAEEHNHGYMMHGGIDVQRALDSHHAAPDATGMRKSGQNIR